jgi:hypothetical protein
MQGSGKKAEEWIAGAEAYLQDRYDRIRKAGGNVLAPSFALKFPLDALEAKYFVRGMEEGIFSIDDEGYAQSAVLPASSGKGDQKKILQLFWRRAGRRDLFREGVCQLATVSALVLKYGWRIDQIEMEPTFPDFPHLAWAVDIVLRRNTGTVVACCEVKQNDRELDQLIAGFRYCCGKGPHSREGCRLARNHPKFELCAAIKPDYFMFTSPGREICFKMSYGEGAVTIKEERQTLLAQVDLKPAR